MFRNLLMGTAVACALCFGAATVTSAQDTTAKEDEKKAGQETKKAGENIGDAAKDAGRHGEGTRK